ncbi:MAG: hypothetical protein ACRDNJ_07115 [Solirubrobacteraceae bacterium]
MTASADRQLRALLFGDIDGGVWGAAVSAPEPVLMLCDGAGASLTLGPGEASWSADERGWRLAGDGLELDVEPGGEGSGQSAPEAGEKLGGFQELCRVRGTAPLGGSGRRVDCIGTRCVVEGLEAGTLGSARMVSGWFAADDAFMLLALRAAAGARHADDLVAATLFDPEGWVPVADPRLSTTYTATGEPSRTNLELWVGEGENEYPRRAAGEATGTRTSLAAGRLRLHATPLRCHSRGHDGAGVYLLAEL